MSHATNQPENKMGTMPMNKLLLTMSVPIMISMLIQALYNIVDSIFVGKISQDALNAVSLAFPIQNLIISIAVGTAVGLNALLSKRLGERRFDEANQTAMHGIFLAVASYICFAIFGVATARIFYESQNVNPAIVEYGTDYLIICCSASIGIFTGITMERLLQATGRTFLSMLAQGAGAITNIVLDPILIFGLLGFPRMEIVGAAIATIIGQLVSASLGLYFNLKYNPDIQMSIKKFRLDRGIVAEIYQVGFPAIVMSSVGSVMVFGVNKILISFTEAATAVFGIYFKLQSFVFMPVFGMCNGVVPIVAYNYGARKPDRIIRASGYAMGYATLMMVLGFLAFQLMPAPMIELFQDENATGELLLIGVPALRTISWSFLAAGSAIIASSVFQALGHGVLSLVVSVVRQLVVLLPAAFLFSQLGGLEATWWAFPFAEIFSFLLTTVFLYRIYRSQVAPMK